MCVCVCTCASVLYVNVCVIITEHFLKEATLGLSRPQQQFPVSSAALREPLGQDVLCPHVTWQAGPLGLLGTPLRAAGWERGLGQRPELSLSLCKLRFSASLSERLWRLHERLPSWERYLKVTALAREGQLCVMVSRCDFRPLTPC